MDSNIGAKERVTQKRLIGLFQDVLEYDYLRKLGVSREQQQC